MLKALENLQHLENTERTVLVSTDSRITLESLKNRKNHTYLIEKIRTKVMEMEMQNWKIEFNWIKAHAGHQDLHSLGTRQQQNFHQPLVNLKKISIRTLLYGTKTVQYPSYFFKNRVP